MTKPQSPQHPSRKGRSQLISLERRITLVNDAKLITDFPQGFDENEATLFFEFDGLTPVEAQRLTGSVNFPSIFSFHPDFQRFHARKSHPYVVIKLQSTERKLLL